MPTTLNPTLPRYQEMARQIVERIERRELVPGDRLPSFVEMRQQYGTTQNTVERVYTKLEKEGYIRREAKRGVFVAEPRADVRPLLRVVTQSQFLHNEYYVRILKGIQAEAHSRGAEIILCQEESPFDWNRTDGVILMGSNEQAKLLGGHLGQLPCIATMMSPIMGISLATVDECAGIAASIEHLLALGHRRIGYLTLEKIPSQWSTGVHRLGAYEKALGAAGIEVDPRWERALRESGYEPIQDFVDLGRHKMELWLRDDWAELGCTALLAQNDETAIGAMQAMEDAGIRVPEQVSVMGFDGIGAGTCIRPRLTTITVPLEEIGAATVAAVMDTGGGTPTSIILPPKLTVRDSTTAAPGAKVESQSL